MPGKPYFNGPREFVVRVSVANVDVTATVDLHKFKSEEATPEFAFYLMRGNSPVWRGAYSSSNTARFAIDAEGTYTVKAFVRVGQDKQSRRSEPFTVQAETIEASNLADREITESLPFAQLDYPHQDFALVSFGDQSTKSELLRQRVDELGMHVQRWGTIAEPIYAVSHNANKSSDVMFSGMTRTQERFVFGQQDLRETEPQDFLDNVGDFTVAVRYPWGAEISTDYFGVGQVYYYSSKRVTCVSNRYHLLLLLLTGVGEPLTIDRTKARATLQAVNQPFTQNFSTGMEVAGCKTTRPGNMLRMRGSNLEFAETGIARVFSEATDQELHPDYYWQKIRSAGEEIVDNLKVALDHPTFESVRVDLTGGLDARLLFTALARLQEYKEKVHIHTADVAGSPHDLDISLALTRETGFDYDTLPRESQPIASTTSLLENISYNLGTYFGIRSESRRSHLPNTLRVNGFYGEACARPYFARLIFGRDTERLSPGDFGPRYIESISDEDLPLERHDEITSLFRSEIDALPGQTSADKMDVFYLAYRNGLHCSDRWLNHTLAPGWGPLQSKELFELKWKTFNTFKNIKVQVDVTEHLDADLAQLPIGRIKDNGDRHALDPNYPSSDADLESWLAVSHHDYDRYRQAEKIRGTLLHRVPNSDSQAIEVENKYFTKVHNANLVQAITSLNEDFKVLSNRETAALGRYLEAHVTNTSRPQHRGVVIANKILSIYHQCVLIGA